ncbi:Fur family transcriptional regulator [Comamonas sp. NoAH]|uniref:Fur family transcriptional regulator n=1 Tax=Comamonas halotolerans TaxID=3041496 RepID=UPI0024E110A6|nr:transcriptional repressor [Comamonas sp. NoAH]
MLSHSKLAPLALPAGMRATRAVRALLALLPHQPQGGWTQAMVEEALLQQGVPVNRVTVYRALDRLAEAGLLQRLVDEHRITRYWVLESGHAAPTAHMECKGCHQPMPLDESASSVQAALQALRQAVAQTTGVATPLLDVTLQGECAHCASDAAHHPLSTTRK